ncbi:uncharacterized protein LOC128959615 [Oppia nitens]|uniref:uncharacterized protein LOC128959615 n=1 Tax=Oppia nitens TaxID=1686743 RepID=UPI0023DBCE62|nr:uncharacterized protein LOC128959615 [Oppia nitens]
MDTPNDDKCRMDQMSDRLFGLSLRQTNDDMYGEGSSSCGSSGCRLQPPVLLSRQTSYIIDSMDRFGDDMMELILSYLSFNDKVTLESVSKQWQRVVYNTQTELVLNRSDTEEHNTLNKLLKDIEVTDYATGFANYAGFKAIDKPSLESILKKCPLLRKLNFQCYIDGDIMQMVGKHCHYLKSIECNPIGLKESTLREFGRKYGDKLQVIRFNDSNYCSAFLKKFFIYCQNVREVYTEDNSAFICDDPMFLPKLEVIKSIDIRTEQLNQLKILSDKYWETMKTIKIYTYHMIGHQLKNALTHISQFNNLESLGLSISIFDEDIQVIDENIAEISKNCVKLKKLNFTLNNESVISNKFFNAFNKLQSIEKLSLEFFEITKKLDGSVECLKNCSKLRHLVISYKELTEEFFQNIHLFLPNLKIIDIDSDKQMTNKFMESMSKLANLKKIVLRHSSNAHKDMTDEGLCLVINNCSLLQTMVFSARPNITHKTIEVLINSALLRPKININFSCGFSGGGDEGEFATIDINNFVNKMPENLKISIDMGVVNEDNNNV